VSWVRRHPAVPWAAAAAIYIAASYLFEDSALAFPLVSRLEFTLQYAAVGLIAMLVLIPAIFGQDAGGWPRRLLAHRTTTWLGLISYGIFLWQLPVLVGLTDIGVADIWPDHPFLPLLVLGFAGTVACASISYYALELPLMRRFRGRSPRAAATPAPAAPDRAGARR
jgi:peptidoglycan/LPS O-acetylase OafA/YrhL